MNVKKPYKYKGFTIRPRGSSWQVDRGTVNGRRVQSSFKKKIEAEGQVDAWIQEANDDRSHRVSLQDMSDDARVDVLSALKRLEGKTSLSSAVESYVAATDRLQGNGTIEQAVSYFIKNARLDSDAVTLGVAYERYYSGKEKANRRPRTLEEIRYKLGRLVSGREELLVHMISTEELDVWLDGFELKGNTRDSYRRQLVGFFNFAVKREYTGNNPAMGLEKYGSDERIPVIHTVEELETLLSVARQNYPEMVPYFAIGYFAGLRPDGELKNLNWKDINFSEGWILVRPETAKRRRQRYVDISENLAQCLKEYALNKGAIHFSRTQFRKVRELAKVDWTPDVMRHSYGSYHLAMYEDAAKTSHQMGHTGTDILYNNYRNLVTKKEARKYWSVLPKM
jgi:integrase